MKHERYYPCFIPFLWWWLFLSFNSVVWFSIQMIPIGELSTKRLAAIGQAGKLWRWKRSHHQWLLQFKWKWQKPWKLSEWIKHSDETIVRSRPRAQALITWCDVELRLSLNVDRYVFQHGLTKVQIIAGNLHPVVSHAFSICVLSLQCPRIILTSKKAQLYKMCFVIILVLQKKEMHEYMKMNQMIYNTLNCALFLWIQMFLSFSSVVYVFLHKYT